MKQTNEIDFTDDIIDSRDIIARQEYLQETLDELHAAVEAAQDELDGLEPGDEFDALQVNLKEADAELESFDMDELELLNEVVSQGEDSPDWSHGETLINENYFEDYIRELVNDCYEIPKEFGSGDWPYRHMQMDWEAAADEALSDYNSIEVNGTTYYIRA